MAIMSSSFSSNELVSLEKQVDCVKEAPSTTLDNVDCMYEIQRCVEWIKTNCYKTVCLQFPDFLLPDSAMVAQRLQSILNNRVYIMGDTAYGSCCIDYLTAAHIKADGIIHYGPVCFSKELGSVPCLKIYEKGKLDVKDFKDAFAKFYSEGDSEQICIVLDTPYIIYKDELIEEFKSHSNVNIESIDNDSLNLGSQHTIFISNNNRKIQVFTQTFIDKKLYYYNPESPEPSDVMEYRNDVKLMKRRYFLIEKIKDSNAIGIIVGTLAIKNYLKVIKRIKMLAKLHNKKYYTISVGRPTVAKLANFPEIDIYVLVSCAMNELYESRDFYKPIVTPYDVELALNPNAKYSQFSFDFNSYFLDTELNNNSDLKNIKGEIEKSDVSLITGKIRSSAPVDGIEGMEGFGDLNEIVLKNGGIVALNSHYGAGFLAQRSWKGLEQNLGDDNPVLAQEGRKGLAMGYENEKN